MTGFIETPRFPDEIAYWMVGGRGFKTTVVETYGGDEFRNGAWSQARGAWEATDALRSQAANSTYYFKALRNYYRVCRGQLYAFRFKDFTDFADEGAGVLGTTGIGVAATTAYQLYKNYAVSPLSYQQKVGKPVAAGFVAYVNGTPTGGSLDSTTGIFTFGSQPAVGAPLTWTGTFDVPCRFAFDDPQLGPESSGAMFDWQSLKIMEVRNP